jgi:hypothetical protein
MFNEEYFPVWGKEYRVNREMHGKGMNAAAGFQQQAVIMMHTFSVHKPKKPFYKVVRVFDFAGDKLFAFKYLQ